MGFDSFKRDCEGAKEAVKRLELANKWVLDKKQYK